MIVATVNGQDGRRVPVCKRRIVRLWLPAATGTTPDGAIPEGAVSEGTVSEGAVSEGAVSEGTGGVADPADPVGHAVLAEAVGLAGQVADYLAWQAASLEYLPSGMSEPAVMGFLSMVGTDILGAYQLAKSLQASLTAVERSGSPDAGGLRDALPEHRRRLEGLLAFAHLARDGTNQHLVADEAECRATQARLAATCADLTKLLALLGRLGRPAWPTPPHHRSNVFGGQP
jgi:hypothetical protein